MLNRLKFLTSKTPVYLVYWVTQNCNARCPFCFNWEENLKKNNDLSVAEIGQLAKSLPNLKYITFSGGEPTLRSDLPALVAAFVKHSDLQNCTIVTNGFKWERMLDFLEEICSSHPKLLVNVGVSIDFIGPRHDEYRKLDGCYEGAVKVIKGIKTLRDRYPRLMVGAAGTYTTATRDNFMETATHILKEFKIPFHPIYVRGEVEDPNLLSVDIDEYNAVSRKILGMAEHVLPWNSLEGAFRYALEDMALDAITRSETTKEMQTLCQAGRKALLLESNGNLRLCEMRPDSFGNVRDHGYDVPGMLQQEANRHIIDQVWDDKCNCTWECFVKASLPYDKKKWPRLMLLGARKAIKAKAG